MKHTILVTGSSRGIGRAAAERFAREGHRVALHCHERRAEADALCASLAAGGCSVMAVQGDVADEADVDRLFAQVRERFGPVDVLVNNAGIAPPEQLLTDCTAALWDRVFAVNVRGAFLCCRAALPDMIRKKRGSIVNVSSVWGVVGGSCETPYSASKAALIGLTRALAKEVGPSGVRVNCVAPGVIDTDMMAAFTAEDKAALAEETPVGRLGSADEVAQLLVFLAGESAGYITGQVFGVNGGLVI